RRLDRRRPADEPGVPAPAAAADRGGRGCILPAVSAGNREAFLELSEAPPGIAADSERALVLAVLVDEPVERRRAHPGDRGTQQDLDIAGDAERRVEAADPV